MFSLYPTILVFESTVPSCAPDVGNILWIRFHKPWVCILSDYCIHEVGVKLGPGRVPCPGAEILFAARRASQNFPSSSDPSEN